VNAKKRRFRGAWLIALLLSVGCQKSAAPPTVSEGPRNPPGFEVRYNATIALARMGSDRVSERMDVLKEMLDEEQQLRSFRRRIDTEGKLLPEDKAPLDPVAARTTVESALKAIVTLHEKNPKLDLSPVLPAIEKLTHSDNPVLRNEAEKTKIALGAKGN
jgi:hypothetical protein